MNTSLALPLSTLAGVLLGRGRFHRLRQGSIDEELFDVTAGYEALARPSTS